MPEFVFTNSSSLHCARHFLSSSNFFVNGSGCATVRLHEKWMHVEPFALAMAAAWGKWCLRNGLQVTIENLGPRARYAARMKLFEFLNVEAGFAITEHEEAGRFLPIRQIQTAQEISAVLADISALLHLDGDPGTLAAVRYCVSELLRNVLEHSGSQDGAFVCAHNFVGSGGGPAALPRVSIGVADCGQGIASHLGRVHADARDDDARAITLAMVPGITGALPGMYGTPDNAGAGLFITRCIAKGSGGYFLIASGRAAYRLRRRRPSEPKPRPLRVDPLEEYHDLFNLANPWRGTVVAVEIRTDQISNFPDFFGWVRSQIPKPERRRKKIRFT